MQQKVSPGAWISVLLPVDSFPVHMSIGDSPPEPAFIDHVKARGTVQTWAKRRCPNLRPGRYTVYAHAGGTLTESSITVV